MLENIYPIADLTSVFRKKNKEIETKSVPVRSAKEHESDGWKILKEGVTSARLQRSKDPDAHFGDRVWAMLFRMRFESLSGIDGAQLILDARTSSSQKLELPIVGIDSEIAITVQTRAFANLTRFKDFSSKLEELSSAREKLNRAITNQWPQPHKRQLAIIYFLSNATITEDEKERAKQLNISLFDEQDLSYYEKLALHLGPAAKYQFFCRHTTGEKHCWPGDKSTSSKNKDGEIQLLHIPHFPRISSQDLLRFSPIQRKSVRHRDLSTNDIEGAPSADSGIYFGSRNFSHKYRCQPGTTMHRFSTHKAGNIFRRS